jgi:hypothetical protein
VPGCDYCEGAGRDTSGRPMLPSFNGKTGYDRIMIVSPESAEEGDHLDTHGGRHRCHRERSRFTI